MPHRLAEDQYCTSDTVYNHPMLSATFTLNGKRIFITKDYDDYIDLKKQVTVTHRLARFEPCGGLHKIEMDGTDGSVISFYVSDEDIIHNIRLTESVMEIFNAPAICSFLCSLFFIEMLF